MEEKKLSSSLDGGSPRSGSPDAAPTYDTHTEKRILWKMDIRILPAFSLLYLFSFLDRTAIGNAAIAGLKPDLKLTDTQYTTCLITFFILYGLFEVPSNLMLKKFGARTWIPGIMFCWGLIMMCTGFVKNFQGLLACRILLGAFEAGLFPGVTYYLTCWYRRHESQLRIGIFFSAATVAGAFGGLVAYGLSKHKTAGLAGWRWIFIVEGILTIAVAILANFMITDYPREAKYLTREEADIVEHRVKYDGISIPMDDSFKTKYVVAGLKDIKWMINFFIYVGVLTPVYSIALFLPTIIRGMGYTVVNAQLLTVPVYTFAALCVVAFAFASDHMKLRAPFVIGPIIISLIGYAILYKATAIGVRYFATFLAALGAYGAFPAVVTILTNNVCGKTKRSVEIGIQVGIGGMCGMISSSIFPAKDGPHFRPGILINMCLICGAVLATCIMTLWLKYQNGRKEAMIASGEAAKLTPEQQAELGDDSPFFKYTY
ncbi:major facilitator superfamily domain-containing protein [Mycena rebaudengoi]|nr:major facilitator superfamily domain-containing protein [Mycena rebaudengoi]KAJ7255736.1 major facilitator superfamily domain-containing protein [Mycena rebaudengoi]